VNVPSIARSNSRLKVGDGSAFSRNLKSPHYVGNEVQDQHIGLVPGTGEQGISPPRTRGLPLVTPAPDVPASGALRSRR
jgi:hypothetical protein